MSEWLKTLFVSIFGTHSDIATFIISMIPIVELRGAIPFGSAASFWGENALPLWKSLLISLGGSSLVCVILTFLFFPFFNWLKRTKAFSKLALWIERKLKRNSKKIENNAENEKNKSRAKWLKIFGVFGFVAIPLPLTGVWTGTCLALFIGLNKKQTLCSVLIGNAIAGCLMTIISYFFADNTAIVLYAFLILVVIFILVELIRKIVNKILKKNSQNETDNKLEPQSNLKANESETASESEMALAETAKSASATSKTVIAKTETASATGKTVIAQTETAADATADKNQPLAQKSTKK